MLDLLDRRLHERGIHALFIGLSTDTGRRSAEDIRRMAACGWPMVHREGGADLSIGELQFDLQVRAFNGRSREIKTFFVNQFGWDRQNLRRVFARRRGIRRLAPRQRCRVRSVDL